MSIKDIPGVMTMPKTERDWVKFVLELSDAITTGSGGASGDFVTLDTTQTITGAKDFTTAPTVNGEPVWNNENVGTQINSLPLDSTPDVNNDYIVTYDASDDAPKKVLPSSIGGGSSDDDELLHWFFE